MRDSISDLPYLTADLPGIGGRLRCTEDDFQVEELPAYPPEGAGDHVFAWIEKRDLTTPAAVDRMARALGVRAQDVGWAGMKDRHAVTRQLLSFPPPTTPEAVRALAGEVAGVQVLWAERHRHKLRTGHLHGNRFALRIRETDVDADTAAARARAILERLSRPPGSPNWFGMQRFGAEGNNAEIGRALIVGAERGDARGRGRRGPTGRQKRLYVSAFQSMLFNEYLRRRMLDGLLDRVIEGDLLQKRASGGVFCSTDPAADQARLDAGELAPTGPMYGHRLMCPPPDSAAGVREAAVLADAGIELKAFERVGKLGEGTRRALAVDLGMQAADQATDQATEQVRTAVTSLGDRSVEICFALPAGSYATAVLREIIKGPKPFPE